MINTKIIYSYLMRGVWALVGAAIFGVITFFIIWERIGGDALTAYILNGVMILFVTIEDKIRLNYLCKGKQSPFKNKILSFLFDYLILEKHDLGSIKSSLYLFYILVLISSHMLIINPYLFWVSESVRSYFTTVGYGLIILIAVDKFVSQFKKDYKSIGTYEDSHEEI